MFEEKVNNRYRVCGFLIAVIIFMVVAEICRSKYLLEITNYNITIDKMTDSEGVRIVQLTDIHGAAFGRNNQRLLAIIAEQKPDVVIITGDIVNSHRELKIRYIQELISQLNDIAPVYISLGNQEYDLIYNKNYDIIKLYQEAGATVLDFSYVDVELKGNKFRIGGIYGYCQPIVYSEETHRDNEAEFLLDFQDTDAYKLLLCHLPVSWIQSYSLYEWDIDMVFAGHVHGGQVRIPHLGGLWAPDMGWFPGKLCGIYNTTEEGWTESREKLIKYADTMGYNASYNKKHTDYYPSYLVLSRGLGNTDLIPRFNNVPEIVVVDLIPNIYSENN